MFDKINFKKLMEQDPTFKDYVKNCLLEMFLLEDDGNAFLASVHSFYNMGMTEKQVIEWVRNMKAGQ